MNRTAFLILFLGLALVAFPVYGQVPTGTTTLTFDGFCDGATITYSGSGSFISGTHDNYDCAGSTTFVGGAVAQDSRLKPIGFKPQVVANLTDNVGGLALGGEALQLYLDFVNNSWSFYAEGTGSGAETLLNKGTFTISDARVPLYGGVGAWQGAGGMADDSDVTTPLASAFPKGTYDISPDGFCDYFHLTAKGNKVGGVHDISTNCGGVSAPAAANNSTLQADLNGTAGASLVLTDNEWYLNGEGQVFDNYYFNFTSNTWAVYVASDSTGLVYFNSGTFTLTPNGPTVRGLPVSSGLRLKH